MYIPAVFLFLTASRCCLSLGLSPSLTIMNLVAVVLTIGFRIVAYSVNMPYLAEVINILQIGMLTMSLVSNLSATSVVGATAWCVIHVPPNELLLNVIRRHIRAMRTAFSGNKRTTTNQILILVVETG